MANTTRTLNKSSCFCPDDCNSIIFTDEITSEQLYPLFSQTFQRLTNKDNYLGKLKEKLKNAKDVYEQKILQDRYDDIIRSSSVAHFYFKESGIIKYSQEEVFGSTEFVGRL